MSRLRFSLTLYHSVALDNIKWKDKHMRTCNYNNYKCIKLTYLNSNI